MRQAIKLGVGILALVGATFPASAADIARKAPPAPAVAPAPVFSWNGFYIGIGLGGRWTETDWTTFCLQPTLVAGCNNAVFGNRFNIDNPATFDQSGFRVSGYLGYNWQFGSWLLGIEGDFGWADNEVTRFGIPGTHLIGVAGGDLARVRDNWDASIRGRLGWLFTPQALFYVTGGATWLDKEVSASCTAGSFGAGGWCALTNFDTVSHTLFGWTVGAGFEWMFAPSWILRAEYRFSDYSNDSLDVRFFGANALDTFDARIEQQTHTAYVGLSYLFNWGAPVGPRY